MDKEFIANPVEAYEKLKAENAQLKEEMTELEEKFLTLNGKSYSYYTTLQEIKAIAETAINGGYATKSSDYSEGMEIIGHYVMQKITKAEEEE